MKLATLPCLLPSLIAPVMAMAMAPNPPVPIEIGPGRHLGTAAWGKESNDEFSGWRAGDIVYLAPEEVRVAQREDSTMAGYRRPSSGGFFLRLDFASLDADELHRDRPSVTLSPVTPPPPGWWGRVLAPLRPAASPTHKVRLSPKFRDRAAPSHWSPTLASMEAFVPVEEWSALDLEVRVGWKGREEILVLPRQPATVTPALVAVVAHGNQPVSPSVDLEWHVYDHPDGRPFVGGMHNLLETHAIFGFPVNLHLSGSLLAALSWSRQDPSSEFYPKRDGAHFLGKVREGLSSGWASLVGGVFAEHIMPYFEGEVNVRSMRAYGDLVEKLFGITEGEMPVMHVPERVMQSDSGWGSLRGRPYTGDPFPDILAAGYRATYLDEVTHLHHWFYPEEDLSASWTDSRYGKWAGDGGDDDEPYHHKLHRINGVLCFVINDREDSAKFYHAIPGSRDKAGIHSAPPGIKWPLLEKAAGGDPNQLTLLFDDWEAFAGNCFNCAPLDNAARWHQLVAWMHSRPWIKGVHLRDVLAMAESNPAGWVVDHGEVDGKRMLAYEWLQRATEHSYDNWYYGSSLEESFFSRRPVFSPDGRLRTALAYGDLSEPRSLIARTWEAIRPEDPSAPVSPAELGFFAMAYETAWHDEDMPLSSYKSRNYQRTFDRIQLGSMEDFTPDRISGWALDLHGHLRKSTVPARAAKWASAVRSGAIPPSTTSLVEDIDLDGDSEYILQNDRVFAVMERWGARFPEIFTISPSGQAVQVVGVGVARPSSEGEGEENSTGKVSAFQDTFAEGPESKKYIDMPHRVAKSPGGFSTVSEDGLVRKKYSLEGGVLSCSYDVADPVGRLHVRFGLSPDWPALMAAGPEGMSSTFTSSEARRVSSKSGAWAEVACVPPAAISEGDLAHAGYRNRGAPMTEQVEVYSPPGKFEVRLAVGHE